MVEIQRVHRRHQTSLFGRLFGGLPANEALEEIAPENRALPEVLQVRVAIYRALKRWESMATVAQHLAKMQPQEPQHWVDWAYATRRS